MSTATAKNIDACVSADENEDKMLGSLVPSDIYWAFKTAVSTRKESMREAIINAANLYIDIRKEEPVSDK